MAFFAIVGRAASTITIKMGGFTRQTFMWLLFIFFHYSSLNRWGRRIVKYDSWVAAAVVYLLRPQCSNIIMMKINSDVHVGLG